MGDKLNEEQGQDYFAPGAATFDYNNVTGGADSASGGSGGSGMECMQLRSQPFHYLISEQAKSIVALQELQNEVGALLEFRDLVIETFPNLRSKMSPSPAPRRDWEPGVRVRRKLPAPAAEPRAKPQPSVQDSGFSTETSCGKDASRSRPGEDDLLALLDVIQRKGGRLREDAELLRAELEPRTTAEDAFNQALDDNGDLRRLRAERDTLLARTAQLEADAVFASPGGAPELGRLDRPLGTPARPPRLPAPDSRKFAAILSESNPIELQRQLLMSTVQNQLLRERLKSLATQRSTLLEKLEKAKDVSDDLKFRLEEKAAELESARSRLRGGTPAGGSRASSPRVTSHTSMRHMEHLPLPDDDERISETPRRRPSRIPLHTANKSVRAPAPPRARQPAPAPPAAGPPAPPRRAAPSDTKARLLVAEYVARTSRLAPLFPRSRPLPEALIQCNLAYQSPHNLAMELNKSILYENAESLWSGKPQQYFESMTADSEDECDADSLAN